MLQDNREFSFSIVEDERGNHIEADEEAAEALDGAFIDWCHRGYLEPKRVMDDGRLSWVLTPFGKQHINDIIKVKEVHDDTMQS